MTGRILNHLWKKPSALDISDVEAYAILDSAARCPQFHYRYPVHPKEGLSHDSVLLLRVYTLDVDSGEMVVIGNCALDLYKEDKPDKVLNIDKPGCHGASRDIIFFCFIVYMSLAL